MLFNGACASTLSLVAASGVAAADGTSSGVGRHDRDAQVCGFALGVRAEVEAAMLLKYRQGSGYTVQVAAHERASGPSYS